MTRNETIAQALHGFLSTNPGFPGTSTDIAVNLGIHPIDLDNALYWLRRPEIIAIHGWTVPYQRRGRGWKDWRVLDLADGFMTGPERNSGHESLERRNIEVVHMIARTIALLDLIYGKTDHRTAYARAVMLARRTFDGAQAMLEATAIP